MSTFSRCDFIAKAPIAAAAVCDGVRVKGSQIEDTDAAFGPDKVNSIHLEKPLKARTEKPIQLEISLA